MKTKLFFILTKILFCCVSVLCTVNVCLAQAPLLFQPPPPKADTSKFIKQYCQYKNFEGYYTSNQDPDTRFYKPSGYANERILYSEGVGEDTYKLRYEITDNENFNKVLKNCKMVYELSHWKGQERVIAVYNGEFYSAGYCVDLMEKMGAWGTIPIKDQLSFIEQWRIWIFKPNFEIDELTKIETDSILNYDVYDKTKYDAYICSSTNGKVVCTMVILAEIGTSYINRIYYFMDGNIYDIDTYISSKSTKGYVELVQLKQNNINIAYKIQTRMSNQIDFDTNKNYRVYYYDANNTNVQLALSNLQNVGSQTKLRLYRVNTNNIIDITQAYESGYVSTTGTVTFDISNKVTSGYYFIYYQKSNGTWERIYQVILIPETITTTTSLGTSGKSFRIRYLKQFFDSTSEETTYINAVTATMSTTINNYISENWISGSQLIENDNILELYLVVPQNKNYFTFYNQNFATSTLATTSVGTINNYTEINIRAGYQNTVSEHNYQDLSQVIKLQLSHEVLHWVIFSKNPKILSISNQNRSLTWAQEGICAMAEVYWNPTLELRNNSIFAVRSISLFNDLQTQPIFYYAKLDEYNPYYRALFFYFIKEKYGISAIKTLINNIDTYFFTGNTFVANGNPFENAVKNWLNSATNNQSDNLIGDFYSILLKKDFLLQQIPSLYNNLYYTNNTQIINMNSINTYIWAYLNYSSNYIRVLEGPQTNIRLTFKTIIDNFSQAPEAGDYHIAVCLQSGSNYNYVYGTYQSQIHSSNTDIYADISKNFNEKIILSITRLNNLNITDADYCKVIINKASVGIVANFHANKQNVEVGGSVQFYNDSQGNIASYYWTFEGGTPATSTSPNPTVVFNGPASTFRDVSLTVISQTGEVKTKTIDNCIHIFQQGILIPNFVIDGDKTINAGSSVKFINTSTNIPENKAQLFRWVFSGYGYCYSTGNISYELNPTVQFNCPGVCTVTLLFYREGSGYVFGASDEITVLDVNAPEITTCNFPESNQVGQAIWAVVELNAVYDANRQYTFVFDYGNGYQYTETTNSTFLAHNYTYNFAGNYTFTVNIYDQNQNLLNFCTKSISIVDFFAPIQVNISCNPPQPMLGQPFTLTANNDGLGNVTYQWYKVNSQNYYNPIAFESNQTYGNQIFQPGNQVIRVTVNDNSGRWEGEAFITLVFPEYDNCVNAKAFVCSQSTGFYGVDVFAEFQGNFDYCEQCNIFGFGTNGITDIRWTIYDEEDYLEQKYVDLISNPDDIIYHFVDNWRRWSYGVLVLECWNRYAADHTYIINFSANNILNNTTYSPNAPYYSKLWYNLGTIRETGTKYLCGSESSNKKYYKNKIIAADHNDCSYTVVGGRKVDFLAMEEITLREGFEAEEGSDFIAKLVHCDIFASSSKPHHTKSENQEPNININIYPNPTSQYVNIQIESLDEIDTQVSVDVIDNYGKILKTKTFPDIYGISIDISDFAPAEYTVKVTVKNKIIYEKIVLM